MEDRENKNYINAKIHPIFEKLIIDLLLVKPEEPVSSLYYTFYMNKNKIHKSF